MKATIAGWMLSTALTPEPQVESLPSVVMEGCGSSQAQALDQAFKKAIEFHSGSVIVNESAISNDRLTQSQTLDYSSGRVDKYHLINQHVQGVQTCVTAEIWVKRNHISHRILGHQSSQQQFDGTQHRGQISSLQEEQIRGDRLLAHVIKDYPTRAFKIEQGTYSLVHGQDRKTLLRVPYVIRWNKNFLIAAEDLFNQLLAPLTQYNVSSESAMAVALSHPTSRPIGNKLTWLVAETPRAQVLHQGFQTHPRIQLVISNSQGQPVIQECWRLASEGSRGFVTYSDRHVRLYGNYVERNLIEMVLPESVVANMAHLQQIELSIVSDKMCG